MLLIWVKQDRATSVKSSLKLTHQEMAMSAYYLEMWRSLPEQLKKLTVKKKKKKKLTVLAPRERSWR